VAYPTPVTAKIVALASELGVRAKITFLADGAIDDDEHTMLAAIQEITDLGQEADDGRKAAISLLNIGDITEWHQRQWRERHRSSEPPQAA
jgi:hypothetical protein